MNNITPLNANSISSLLQNTGLTINPVAQSYMGVSKVNLTYTTGKTVNDTCLRLLTYAINQGYNNYTTSKIDSTTYNNLISIGSSTIPALGNSKPSTYAQTDPSGTWTNAGTPATTGYANDVNPNYPNNDIGQGQEASWLPYTTANPNVSVTQWGYIRLHALQAWNEFNFNGDPTSTVRYQDFVSSFMAMVSFMNNINYTVNAFVNGPEFLDGVYSTMNDLITADIAGISLATKTFGQDCITLGKVIDLTQIQYFGLPSSLLRTLRKYNAFSQSLSLALLSSGLSITDIESILAGVTATPLQEQQIYGAFLIIVGQDLVDTLVPLNCKTVGLESLSDLLNVKKIFPNSYQSLTVPLYNLAIVDTNSKTYYPIYDGTNVSPRINTPAVKKQVGTIILPGSPTVNEAGTTEKIQELPTGFDSYLTGILPNDIALAAGAFSYTIRQVTNIQNIDFETFAQMVFNLETTKNLDLVNGTNVPVDSTLMNQGNTLIGLGSGPNRTYTVSDFFGCMSGLPYNWQQLTQLITDTQTRKLSNIYNQLYLATTWENATLSYTVVEVAPNDWRIATLTINDNGGGYGRGTASAPTISLPYGATATCTIGTDPANITTFGRVTSVTLTNPGSNTTNSGWYAYIQAPPTATLPVESNGDISTAGTNTVYSTTGWPSPMQTVVSDYITQANTEIQAIYNTNTQKVQSLISLYNQFGNQLMIEQRARYTSVPAVPTPRDLTLNPYPTMQITFADSLLEYAKNTFPHMEAQTIEAISDFSLIGGQSIVASMREARNKSRLQIIGIPLDNEIPTVLLEPNIHELLCNGSTTYNINGVTYTTTPSTEVQQINGQDVSPEPYGVLLMPGAPLPNQNTNPYLLPNNYPPIINEVPVIEEIQSPVYVIDGIPLDTGQSQYPGSFAGSRASNLVPMTLNSTCSSGTILPGTYSVQEAIDQVIHCNCDCWLG